MSTRPLRFVQASDLHLGQPLFGLEELPDHLCDQLFEAPQVAASRVFETAIREEVDFLVLCGDVLALEYAGARDIAFLMEQFERLDSRGIAVYWVGGRADARDRWPRQIELPAGVHLFGQGKTEEISHFRGDQLCATVLGRSADGRCRIRSADYRPESADGFTLAAGYGKLDRAFPTRKEIDYWALGGLHRRRMASAASTLVHYAGCPQGRNPRERGPRGCTVVEVRQGERTRTRLVPTDAVRFHTESLSILPGTTRAALQRQLCDRAQQLAVGSGERPLLISWRISIERPDSCDLDLHDLVAALRSELARTNPAVWVVAVQLARIAQVEDSRCGEDSILGEFLRILSEYQSDAALPLELEGFLPEGQLADELHSLTKLADPCQRDEVLADVALLGSRLLGGH